MGLTISLLPLAWVEVVRDKVACLLKEIEDVVVRSFRFNSEDDRMTVRSVGFKRNNSASNGSRKVVYEESLSFKIWEAEKAEHDAPIPSENHSEIGTNSGNDGAPQQNPAMCPSPRPKTELDAAAVKLQKVYKSYRTRRNLADCAVVVEELWWKAIDFASLKRSSVSFFDGGKPETAVSRWARARTRAAKVGKGLSKSDKAQKLALQHWLEAIDPRHRYGHNLHFYYEMWFKSESTQPFFYWLDIGDGKEVNLEKCPRTTLQNECIKYLGPNEREAYEIIVENGKLVYKKTGMFLNTTDGSKWIFVLSTWRTLYVGKKKKGKFQHSSFLAGAATTAAGRLVVKEGILKVIWPYSGHYLPTEENFKEFIKYLEDNGVDLKTVKRFSMDRDENPSFNKLNYEPVKTEEKETGAEEDQPVAAREVANESDNEEQVPPKPSRTGFNPKLKKTLSVKLGERLPCNWTTGAGPRIGCVRDYPSSLQCRALEHVNLSPTVMPSLNGNKGPIPSPRPSPRVRLSPRLAYLGTTSPPSITLTIPKPKRK